MSKTDNTPTMESIPAKATEAMFSAAQALCKRIENGKTEVRNAHVRVFGKTVPEYEALATALVDVRKASDLPESTTLQDTLKAARKALADDPRCEYLPTNGSKLASDVNAMMDSTNETRTEYLKTCERHVDVESDTVIPPCNPTLNGYVLYLRHKAGTLRSTAQSEVKVSAHGRVTRPKIKEETPAVEESAMSTEDLVKRADELFSKLPAHFVPTEYTVAEITAIAEWASSVVIARTKDATLSADAFKMKRASK